MNAKASITCVLVVSFLFLFSPCGLCTNPELIYPAGGETFTAGESVVGIEWKNQPAGTATIQIRYAWWGEGHSTPYVATLVEGLAAATTTYAWHIPCDIDGSIVSGDPGTYPTGTTEGKIQVRFLDTGKALLDACSNGIFFTVTPCGPFALVKPENGAEVLSPRPTLAWSGGTAPYSVKVGLDANFVNVLWEKTDISDKTVEVPTDLPSHTTLWCHVSDSSDPNVADSNRFIRRGPPTLTGPADGATLPEGPVTFEWQPLGKVDVYTVQIATDPGFSNVIGGGSGVETQNTLPMPTGTYYWHVHASTKSGDVSEWSAMRTVNIGSEQEAQVIITAAQSYDADSRLLCLRATIQDTLKGPVTEGTVTWCLMDLGGAERVRGTLGYSSASRQWTGSVTLDAPGLVAGNYEIAYSVVTTEGRHATVRSSLFVKSLLHSVSGYVKDSSTGNALPGVQVALFESGPFWTLVNDEFNGIVPALAALLSRLTPARGPVATAEDGRYEWPDVPPGGSYVVVAAKEGYEQGHTEPFPVSADSPTVTINPTLSPSWVTTFAVLTPYVDGLRDASRRNMDRNATAIINLASEVRSAGRFRDNVFTEGASFVADILGAMTLAQSAEKIVTRWGEGKTFLSLLNIANGIDPGAYDAAIGAEIMDQGAAYLWYMSKMGTQLSLNDLNSAAQNELDAQINDPKLDPSWYRRVGSTYDRTLGAINSRYGRFIEQTATLPVPAGFDLAKARWILSEQTALLDQQTPEHTVFIVPPNPAIGIFQNCYPGEYRAYLHFDSELKQWVAMETLMSGISAVGSAAGLVLTPTPFSPAGVALFAVGTGASVGKLIAVQAQTATLEQLGRQWGKCIMAYQRDNGQGGLAFGSALDLIDSESLTPRYLLSDAQFGGEIQVNLNLPYMPFTEVPYMFTLGIPGLDIAHGTATIRVKDISGGSEPLDYRLTAFGTWSPVTVFGALGISTEECVTSFAFSRILLYPGNSADLALPFTGYSRNWLSTILKPHYFTVETYCGPYRLQPVTVPYMVFGLGQPLISLSQVSRTETGRIPLGTGEAMSPVARANGQIPLRELLAEAPEVSVLIDGSLSAAMSVLTAHFTAPTDLHAADLRLFAPRDAAVCILVTDGSGRRLGYSALDGITYNELLGSVTNTAHSAISLRLLGPPAGEEYAVDVVLLSPGPRDVPVTLFYEPVRRSGAVMTAFPSPVILDGQRGTVQNVLLRLAEASGQQPLTGVTATIEKVEKWGGGPTLPVTGNSSQQVGVVPAGEQRYVSWNVSYLTDAERGTYIGTVTLSSNETADLTVPVVALVRGTTETVSFYEGPNPTSGTLQKTLTLGADGKAQTWVRVPKGCRVVYAAMGVVGGSDNLIDPSLDVGLDGEKEWAFSGKFDLGVFVDNVQGGFNTYLDANAPSDSGWDVPIDVEGNAGESVLLNGVQLYLERTVPIVSVSATAQGFELSIDPTEIDKTYVVKFANSMSEPWSVAATLQGQGGKLSWVDDGSLTGSPPSAVGHRFYVIEVR